MTDRELLEWMHDHMELDDYGYWLPDVCIWERGWGQDFCPRPTFDEFRTALSERAAAEIGKVLTE